MASTNLRARSFSIAHVTGEKRPVVFLDVAEAENERLRTMADNRDVTDDKFVLRVARAIWDAMVDDEPPDDKTLWEYGYIDAANAAIRASEEQT